MLMWMASQGSITELVARLATFAALQTLNIPLEVIDQVPMLL